LTSKSLAEQELAEFLAPYGPWLERVYWHEGSPEDFITLCDRGLGLSNIQADRELKERYESILMRIPARWRAYCKARKRWALEALGPPPGVPGRPRKDALAEEAELLQSEGKKHPQIASILNKRHGERITTADAVRKLLAAHKKRKAPAANPDKT
jgi:hypothetical protein